MSKKPQPSLAIAFSVHKANKKKMAKGGHVSKDQEPVHAKKNSKLGDEYEGDNKPGIEPGAKSNYEAPPTKEFMAKKFPKGSDTPMHSGSDKPKDEQYLGKEAADPLHNYADGGHVKCMHCGGDNYAHGGSVYGSKAEADGVQHPMGLEEDNDHMGPSPDDFMNNKWTGKNFAKGGNVDTEQSHMEPELDHLQSIAESILRKRKQYANGGAIDDPFDHGEGISDFQEEGPGTRQKYNQNARDFNAGDDKQISKQPKDSNEKGDSEEEDSENKHDRVSQIQKKLKSKRA